MKKILFFIPLLWSGIIYADVLTPQDPVLMQPSTGVIDLKRSWLDKLNENSRIISSTISTNITSINNLNTSTGTLLSLSSAVATYLQLSSATAIYLQDSSATATYLALSSAVSTYLSNSSASLTYLYNSSAAQNYPLNSSITANYLTISSAATKYILNTPILQSGTTFFVSSGSVTTSLTASTVAVGTAITYPDGTTQKTAPGASQWTASGNDIYNSNSGNVGIATNTPTYQFQVTKAAGTTGPLVLISTFTSKILEVATASTTINNQLFVSNGSSISEAGRSVVITTTPLQMTWTVGISSASRQSTGVYRFVLAIAATNANYPVIASGLVQSTVKAFACNIDDAFTRTVTTFQIRCVNIATVAEDDPAEVHVWIPGR